MIKAILFDLDGTLVNTNELVLKSFQHTFNKHLSFKVTDEEIRMLFGEPLKKSLSRFDENNINILMNTYGEFNEKNHDKLCKKFNGVEEALVELKSKGLKLAVVTSKRRLMAERGLKFANIMKYMDAVVTPEDTDKHKPDGEPALKACELLGVSSNEAIMVGDSFYDILCGRNAGCITCAVSYTSLSVEIIKKHDPDYFIDDIRELIYIVEKENSKEEKVV